MGIGLPEEKDLPVLRVQGVRKEDQDAFFLVHPAQVENIPVLLEWHGAVGTDGIDIIGVEHGKAARFHVGPELLPVAHKKT